ncbi:MAG: hypothetical protein ABEI13_03955, partial [Candidatus Paceibacteria bacterium]
SPYRIFQGKLLTKHSSDLPKGIQLLKHKLDVPDKHFLLDLQYTSSSPPFNEDTIREIKACFFYLELPNYPKAKKDHQQKFEFLLSEWLNLEEREVYINKNHTEIDNTILIPYNQVAESLYGVYTEEYEEALQT